MRARVFKRCQCPVALGCEQCVIIVGVHRTGVIRRALVGAFGVLGSVLVASGAAAGVPNPVLPPGCGVDIGIVVDTSGSIIAEGQETFELVRRASAELVRSLAGTPSSVSAWRFAGEPEVVTRRLRLDDAEQVETVAAALSNLHFDDTLIEQGTNWDAALRAVENVALDVVILVTDGSPQGSGRRLDEHSSGLRSSTEAPGLRAAVHVADRIKAKGTRIIAVGVGDVAEKGLETITGPERDNDWFAGDFASLGTSLRTVAGSVCGSGIVTRVLVDGVEHRSPNVRIDPMPDGRAAAAVVRDLAPGKYRVTADAPDDALLSDVDCDVDGTPYVVPVDYRRGSVEVEIARRQVASCAFSYSSLALLARDQARSGCPVPVPATLPLVAGLAALLIAVLRYAARWSGAWPARIGAALIGVAAAAAALRLGVGGVVCGWAAVPVGLLGLALAAAAYLVVRLAERSQDNGDGKRPARSRTVVVVALVATAVAALVPVLMSRGESARTLRINDRIIQNAEDALTGLERFVSARIVAAGGVADERTRCYYVRDAGGEVDDRVLCGPIRRPDETEPPWERYDVRVLPQGDDRAYVHVDRRSRVAETPPTSGLVRPDATHDVTPPVLAEPTGSPAPARMAPGVVVRAAVLPPDGAAAGRTVDFGSEATVSLRAWAVGEVDTDDGARVAAPGEHLVALDVERSAAAEGAAVRVVDGDRRLDLPPGEAFGETLVVSLLHPDQATVRVGLQGLEVPFSLPSLEPVSSVPDTQLSEFVKLDKKIPAAEIPVRNSPLPGLPATESMAEWVLRGVQLTARHPRFGWAGDGNAWLVAKVDDFGPPCPLTLVEKRCEIQIAESFTVRDLEGRVHPATGHAKGDLPGFDRIVDVVFTVPAALTESVLALRPTYLWEVAGKAPERVAFPRHEVRFRLTPRSAEQVLAERIVLAGSDLPGSWRTHPFVRPPGVDESQQRFERCLGRPGMQARETARARSDIFHDRGRDDRQLWAAASFQRSADENAADLRALQGDQATGCLRAAFQAVLVPEGTDLVAGQLTFEPRTLLGLDVPYAAYRAVVVPEDRELPAFYADLVTAVVGRVTIEFSALDSKAPVPDDVQLAALRAMVERARTAPPAATPSGARTVAPR